MVKVVVEEDVFEDDVMEIGMEVKMLEMEVEEE